jgi:hypothetical protein
MTNELKLRRKLRKLLRDIQQIEAETGWELNYWQDNQVWRFLKVPEGKDQTQAYLGLGSA